MTTIIATEVLVRNLSTMKSVAHFTEDALDEFICKRIWSQDELECLNDILCLIEALEMFAAESGKVLKEQG